MGGRIVAVALAKEIVRLWLATPFEGGRHARRLEQVAEIERGER
jgi:ribose 5-phosphate isomerase B